MRVCVFCASDVGVDAGFATTARAFGAWLGEAGHTLVWGGCNVGLMQVMGESVQRAGGRTIAILPRFLVARGLAFQGADETIETADMQARKATFHQRAEVFVALPGGVGTWEELLEVLALRKLGRLATPVLLANWLGYYDPLLVQFGRSVEAGFSRADVPQLLEVYSRVPELIARLTAISDPKA